MEAREKDIQELCKAVLNMAPIFWDNPNGGYENTCPLCRAFLKRGGPWEEAFANMADIKHRPECAYLIAKDLSI